eukprot:scaffold120274_cov33-Tisochrysis_lutea.AAC.2
MARTTGSCDGMAFSACSERPSRAMLTSNANSWPENALPVGAFVPCTCHLHLSVVLACDKLM